MDEITERVGEEPVVVLFRACPLLAAINELLPMVSDSEVSEEESSSYTSDECQSQPHSSLESLAGSQCIGCAIGSRTYLISEHSSPSR